MGYDKSLLTDVCTDWDYDVSFYIRKCQESCEIPSVWDSKHDFEKTLTLLCPVWAVCSLSFTYRLQSFAY